METQADLLIVTVTKVESQAVKKVFGEDGVIVRPEPINGLTYHNLGVINGAKVYMTISEMGAGGVGGSQETIRKGIEALSPASIIMVGVAFGIDDEKQSIGELPPV